MNKTVLDKALKILKERKRAAEAIADENYKIALEDKEINRLDKEMRALTIEISKKEFWGRDSSEDNQKMIRLTKKRTELIKNKFGPDFSIVPAYTCPKCKDSGFVQMSPCSCLKELITNILLDLSGTARNLASFEKANFNVFEDKRRKKMELLYSKMEEWCNKVKTSKYKNVGIFGNTGVGKTFLSEAMANSLIKNGHIVMLTSAFNLGNVFTKYHKCMDDTKQSILAPYLDCDVLIIDDLGTEPILKNITLEYLYLIVNERINSGKSIVFSTNLSVDKFRDNYGERIASRLLDVRNSIIINFEGDDLRTKKINA